MLATGFSKCSKNKWVAFTANHRSIIGAKYIYFLQIILEEREQQKIREQQDLQAVYEEKISAIKEEHQLALQQRKMRVVSLCVTVVSDPVCVLQ